MALGEARAVKVVITGLAMGMDIQRAIAAANQEHPDEALTPQPNQWADLAARYDYLRQRHEILKKLGTTGKAQRATRRASP